MSIFKEIEKERHEFGMLFYLFPQEDYLRRKCLLTDEEMKKCFRNDGDIFAWMEGVVNYVPKLEILRDG